MDAAAIFDDFMARKAATLRLMVERGVFETKNGSVTLNFDKDGVLQTIERKDYLYSKRHDG